MILSFRIIFELSFALDSQTMSPHLCVTGSSVVGGTRGRGAPATVFCQIGRAFGDLVVVVVDALVVVVVVGICGFIPVLLIPKQNCSMPLVLTKVVWAP